APRAPHEGFRVRPPSLRRPRHRRPYIVRIPPEAVAPCPTVEIRLFALEPQVLVRRGVRVPRDEREAGLRHARPVAVEEGQLPDGREHRLVVDELLDAMEGRLPPLRGAASSAPDRRHERAATRKTRRWPG